MLISDFIVDETRNGLQTTDASCGEVHLEIDAYAHPSTGELDGSIRGRDDQERRLFASRASVIINVSFLPFLQLYLLQT